MEAETKTPTWKIVGAWALVMVPFLWGIAQTMRSAMNLFRH